jgi:superfamily I DNA/RNA helicase
MEEGRLPTFQAKTEEAIRKERRTCFVGVCRAEHRLTLTRTRRYGMHRQQLSRFLGEMGLS